HVPAGGHRISALQQRALLLVFRFPRIFPGQTEHGTSLSASDHGAAVRDGPSDQHHWRLGQPLRAHCHKDLRRCARRRCRPPPQPLHLRPMTPKLPPIYKQHRLESWEAFLKIITDSPYSNWAFRGHRKEQWPLASALSRYFRSFRLDRRSWPQQEDRILRVFKRKAHQFLAQPPATDDDFQWLALMQHHGAPTRLLDFTWSPYVAAFFSLERATADAAIWGIASNPQVPNY